MSQHPPIYGFDLITDAVGETIDPVRHRVVAVGLSLANDAELYDGDDEADLLDLIDRRLGLLPAGVIATWNGSVVALPMLAARARLWGVTLELDLRLDNRTDPAGPLAELEHPVFAEWRGHQHLDLRRFYSETRWRPIRGRFDPESMIPPANDLARRDPRKDATLARRLAERRWAKARRHVDRLPSSSHPDQLADPIAPLLESRR